MAKDIIVIKGEKFLVPDGYLKKVIAATGKAWGYMSLGPKEQKLMGSRVSGVPTLEFINKLQKMLEAQNVVMWFSGQEVRDKLDQQPFMMFADEVDGKDVPSLLAMGIGDFTGTLKEGVTDSPVLQYIQNYLAEKLINQLELLDNDVLKLTSYITEKELFRKELMASCKDHGALVFMDQLGLPTPVFLKASDQKMFTWGWATDGLNWTGKEEPEAKPEPKHEQQATAQAKKTLKGFAALAAREKEPTVANDNPIHKAPPTDTAIKPRTEKVMMVRVDFPKNASHKDRARIVRKCFNNDLNAVPSYTSVAYFYLEPKKAEALQTLGYLDKMDTSPVEVERPVPELLPAKEPEPEKKAEPAAPTPVTPPNQPANTVLPMMIEAKSAHHLSQMMKSATAKKEIDSSGELIMNPAQMRELTGKLPAFWQKVGLKHIHDTIAFSPKTLQEIGRFDLVALCVHTANLAQAYVDVVAEVRRLADMIPTPTDVPVQSTGNKPKGFNALKKAM